MVTENKILMKKARESLKGYWGLAIAVSLLYIVFILILSTATKPLFILGFVIQLLITGPLVLGFLSFNLSLSRKKKPEIGQLFDGFNNFLPNAKVYLLRLWFTFLWFLLLIIPGIIASIRYSQAYYIILDNKKISPSDAIEQSKKMMRGHKWKYFCLGWRFFGWAILCILTLGVGFIWLIPYVALSYAKFYDDVKSSAK